MHISYHAVNSLVLYFIPVHCISTVHHPHLGIEGVFRFKWHEKLFCRLVPNSLYNLTPPLTNELRGLRGGVRREQREGDSCPHGFGLLCLTEYLWITWNSTENTPNHTSNPTKRFGKGVKLEERVLIVMKTQDFLCFLSCFASFELGKLCFAFFSKLLPPTLLVYSLPDFLTARIVSCWRDENEELIVFHVFSNFLLRLSFALNALLSSFRGRLLNVSPTRSPLPLQPYGTM